jgi:hypothetical protein
MFWRSNAETKAHANHPSSLTGKLLFLAEGGGLLEIPTLFAPSCTNFMSGSRVAFEIRNKHIILGIQKCFIVQYL